MARNEFEPDWIHTPPAEGSFRSIFKWGAPDRFKHPNRRLYRLVKETFSLTDDDFQKQSIPLGNEVVEEVPAMKIPLSAVEEIQAAVGEKNVETGPYARVKYASGKTVEEASQLRKRHAEKVADAAVHPRDAMDVETVLAICNARHIPIHAYSGGSSVTLGHQAPKGGVTLVMSTHMNRVLEINETDQTVTVEPGIFGPDLEQTLNDAPSLFQAENRYTCGHFPQSFEYSTAGGWVVTLGSGQASTYYGDAKDLVISQEYITPAGRIRTHDFPASAAGPDLDSVFLGSEGAFGILVKLKLKIFRYMPENRKYFSFVFPSFDQAVNACREISQAEAGVPSVLRISDAEETDVALKLYGIENTLIDRFMKARGFRTGERCLCIGHTEGEKTHARNVQRSMKKIAKQQGGMYITGYPTRKWEHGRFEDPYMREDLADFGICIDTLETSVKWSNLQEVYREVRAYIKSRPQTVCMTHSSHFYPQGTNLYFIFIARFETDAEYTAFQRGVIETIDRAGGSLSHHHGIGRMMAPYFESHIGPAAFGILRSVKSYLDPNGIINAKGILGLE